jgi:hypothetical protein
MKRLIKPRLVTGSSLAADVDPHIFPRHGVFVHVTSSMKGLVSFALTALCNRHATTDARGKRAGATVGYALDYPQNQQL